MRLWWVIAMALVTAAGARAEDGAPASIRIDDFEDARAWRAQPSDGVELALSADHGVTGKALRLDFRFLSGGGYAVARREVSLELPENYRFVFHVRGEALPNDLEFKLVAASGEDVWWMNRRNFEFPREWRRLVTKKRQIEFAWGPQGGGEIRRLAAIEFAITAGRGGQGTVWIDELVLEPLPAEDGPPPDPIGRASSERSGHPAAAALDGDSTTFWAARAGDPRPWIELDLGREREFGGLVIDWLPGRRAPDYEIESSADRRRWERLRAVERGGRLRDHLHLPESQARYLRLRTRTGSASRAIAIREIRLDPVDAAPTLAAFFERIAHEAPRGRYPRSLLGEQTYWTLVGRNGGAEEGLLGEYGGFEVGKAAFSLEPFLSFDGRLHTWNDGGFEHELQDGSLPIPSVSWSVGPWSLTTSAFETREFGVSAAALRYRLTNVASDSRACTLWLAVRPFQVNPPSQSLNLRGGVAEIRSLERRGRRVRVNDEREIVCLGEPDGFGAAAFDEGDVVEFLARGRLPSASRREDPFGFASGALAFVARLEPGEAREFLLLVPLVPGESLAEAPDLEDAAERFAGARRRAIEEWRALRDRVGVELSGEGAEAARTLFAQLGFILINRDGAALQPGSRSYERSWIRDGSLTSTALLRLGHAEVVRDYIDWFATYLYPSGKVPCCVDQRGADPVPEHDSSGEFIYLVAEYYRFTGDRALVERHWPAVRAAAGYLDSLRRERLTPEFASGNSRLFRGILPPSISHEGYSARPVHSYWDDFFALRGFRDAAFLAGELGDGAQRRRWNAVHAEFGRDFRASIEFAMRHHRIDFIPGSADLGDFDATSTTIAFDPVEAALVPRVPLRRTFERYWEFFRERARADADWEAYTPYELRNVGAFVRLGWRDRIETLYRFFLDHRRPQGWAAWAEVVRRSPRAAGFFGDLPHTWVGSDFVRSTLDLLLYENEAGEEFVLGAGLPWDWIAGEGARVRDLRTTRGRIGFRIRRQGDSVEVTVEGDAVLPRNGILVLPPGPRAFRRAERDGRRVPLSPEGGVRIDRLPARVVLSG